MKNKFLIAIAASTSLYVILYITNTLSRLRIIIPLQSYLATVLMMALIFVFILYRAKKGDHSSRVPWYDYLFIAASLISVGYMVFNYGTVFIHLGKGYVSPLECVLSYMAVVVILEGTRRTVGLPIVIICLFFLFQVFFCNFLPGFLHGRGYPLASVARTLYISTDGIFGTPLKVVSTIVIAFLIFCQFMVSSGADKTFISLPMALLGQVKGGPAKVAVLASAFMAMMSGSAIANVSSTGMLTIPLMKKTGYNKDFAGAVEAVASTGGQLTPPVMGGAIFLMAEWLGLPYVYLCFCAILPALLYYLNVFMVVDHEASICGLKGLPRESLPPIKTVVKEGWVYFLPLILIIYLLAVLRLRPEMAAIYSAGLIILITLFKRETRLGLGKLLNTLADSFKQSLMVIMAVASAGIIIGCLGVTGLGVTVGAEFLQLSGGNLAIMLILSAIAAFIMGMGMHPAVIYIILAVTLAPSLIVAGVPALAAHFFVMVCSMWALITPPVAMAVFAAVAISGGSVMKTGFQATRLGIVLYALPFWFIYRPAILLLGTPLQTVISMFTAIVAVLALSAGTMGHGLTKLNWPERILLIIGALMLIPPGFWNNIAGFGIIGLMVGRQVFLTKYAHKSKDPLES